ncbi:unnamed protein product [Mytilus coruscus]|uniref:Paraneoplastic antigen Ma-like C-terminal domain-containing protein n=1 Tax=Mytilus coruscus TaxID=42192 RepID=A0A6J8EJP0_MYTCO|nr:unnamed protein product [Mytilus coruscus]
MEQSFESVIGATGYASPTQASSEELCGSGKLREDQRHTSKLNYRYVDSSLCTDNRFSDDEVRVTSRVHKPFMRTSTPCIFINEVDDKRETHVDDTGYNTTKLNSKHMTQSQVHFRSLNYDSDSDTEVEKKPLCIDRNPTKHEHRVNVQENNDMYRGESDTPLFSPVRHSDYDYKTQRHHDLEGLLSMNKHEKAFSMPKQNFDIHTQYDSSRPFSVYERKLPTLSSNENVQQKHERAFSMPKQNFDIHTQYNSSRPFSVYERNLPTFLNTERHEPKQYTSNRRLPNHDYMPETRYHAHTYEKSAIGQYRNIEVPHAHVQANMNNCVPIVRDPQQCHVNTSTPMYVNPPGFDNRQEGYNPYLDTGAYYTPRNIELYPNVQPHMSNPAIVMPQPQLSRVAPARKEKEPDIFNGSKTEWVDYIVHFEQVATWNRWSDSEKAQQLSMCLRGPAQKILSDLTLGQLSDYTLIKSALAQRFHPRESEVAYRCEFRNLKRQKGESVADYGYRLRRSAQKAYPALKCSDIEPTVIDQYIHGLNNHELKKHVQFHHPQTLIQAIAFASEFEAFLGSSDRIFKPEGTGTEQSDFTLQTLTCKEENSKPEGLTMQDISKLLDEKLERLFNKDNRVPENQPPKRFRANLNQNNYDSKKRYGPRNREIRSTGSCLNVEVEVNELNCKLLVDTGSPVCILSEQLFEKLNKGKSLLTKSGTSVHTADGTALDIKGKIDIKLKIGKLCLDQELIVAKIDNLSGEKINFKKETSKVCAKVGLIDKVSIPPNSELLVESFIDGHIDNKSGLVESTDFVKQKGLLLVKSLVDTDKKCSLLLLNMNQKTVKLNENTVVGLVSDVDTLEGQGETKSLESEKQVLPEHLQHLVDSTSDKLTEIEKVKLTKLIHEYSSVFAEPGKALGQTDLATHKIDTGNHAPIKIPARRIPLAKKEVVDKELEKMLKDGQIEPSSSPWSAPICLVIKKDGTP